MTTRLGPRYQPKPNPVDETQPSQSDHMFAMIQSLRASLNNINTRLENFGPTSPQRPPKVIPNQEPQVPIHREAYPDN